MEARRQPFPDPPQNATVLAVAVAPAEQCAGAIANEAIPMSGEQAPIALAPEVLARFKPTAQRILMKLIENSGQPLRPLDLRALFPSPEARSTPNRISQYLREIEDDAETGKWLHRWGYGGRGGVRFCMWGTAEQAAVYKEQLKKDTSPRIAQNDRSRPRLPRRQQPDAFADTQPKSAFTDSPALYAQRFESVVSVMQRDAKRGEMVLRAWSIEALPDDDVPVRIGGTALDGADGLTAEVVHAVADSHDSLAPQDILDMVSEFWDERLGLKSIIDRLELLRQLPAAYAVRGWQDSGPVSTPDERRQLRLDFPEEETGGGV